MNRSRRMLGAAVLLGSVPTAAGSAAGTTPADCATVPARDVAYTEIYHVDPNLLSLDIAPVAGECSAPVAIWIHGGGWQVGDKANFATIRAPFYNAQGWLLVSVNYRLVTPAADPPVEFPDFNVDTAAALAWVHEHIDDHGGDPDRLLLVGHSAGAAISAAITADPSYLAARGLVPDVVGCVVLLDTGGYDVSAAAPVTDLYPRVFGDDPAVWAAASPAQHVGEGPLPDRALIVTTGPRPRVAAAERYAELLAAVGVDVELVNVNPLTHAATNRLIGTDDDTMTPLLAAELARCT